MEEFMQRNPNLQVQLMVDDWQVQCIGQHEDMVVYSIAGGAEDLAAVIEDELGCQLAARKAKVLASSAHLEARVRAALGQRAGEQAGPAEPLLGVDYSAGKARGKVGKRSV
eukprot:13832110-Alexandrium_andersonii.AAC.1